jgi:membrane protein required for colicin V production
VKNPEMNLLDAIIAIPLVWGAWRGFRHGLIFEVLMIIGLILGLYLAFKFSGWVNDLLTEFLQSNHAIIPFISLAMIFLAVILMMVLLARFLEAILKITSLNLFNRLAGAAFGLFKWALVVSVILWSFKTLEPHWDFIGHDLKQKSILYQPILSTTSFITPVLEDIRTEFKELAE